MKPWMLRTLFYLGIAALGGVGLALPYQAIGSALLHTVMVYLPMSLIFMPMEGLARRNAGSSKAPSIFGMPVATFGWVLLATGVSLVVAAFVSQHVLLGQAGFFGILSAAEMFVVQHEHRLSHRPQPSA